jgi:hypothetical protein
MSGNTTTPLGDHAKKVEVTGMDAHALTRCHLYQLAWTDSHR